MGCSLCRDSFKTRCIQCPYVSQHIKTFLACLCKRSLKLCIKKEYICINCIYLKMKSILVPSLYVKYSCLPQVFLYVLCFIHFVLMSFRSVAACEAIVKKQYSFLGWEYRETDSDDDDNITGYGKMQIIELMKQIVLSMSVSFANCSFVFNQVCFCKRHNLICAFFFFFLCRKYTSIPM